ncbi:MAG TPA: hypothetical protein VL968_05850 [Rhodocyclaceae bacterium]|nr:hypothetical protein [Rhodocyclaceae bacterium]
MKKFSLGSLPQSNPIGNCALTLEKKLFASAASITHTPDITIRQCFCSAPNAAQSFIREDLREKLRGPLIDMYSGVA